MHKEGIMAYIISHLSLSKFLRLIGCCVSRVSLAVGSKRLPAWPHVRRPFLPDKCLESAVIKEKCSQELQGNGGGGCFYFIKCHDYFSEQLVMKM